MSLCECGCGGQTRLAPWSDINKGWVAGKPLRFLRGHNTRNRPISQTFWAKTRRAEGCWEWQGTIGRPHGYGLVQRTVGGRRDILAHRISWELHFGEIPEGIYVLHKCDNRRCVNPEHLFLGNHNDNMRDMVAKGRQQHGERHAFAKLTEAKVREARELAAEHRLSHKEIAAMMGVKQVAISCAIRGATWKYIK